MANPRASLTVRLCIAAVRLFSILVPARARRDWRLEWEAELYHREPLTMLTVCLLLGGVGLAACCLPARRATRIDPVTALRVE